MSLFCLLYIPLLYFLRGRLLSDGGRPSSGGLSVWALSLGVAVAAMRYLFGPLVTPGGLGLSRWMSGFVDVVGLPALLPLMACGVLVMLRALPRDADCMRRTAGSETNTLPKQPLVDYADFALLWLIPLAAIRSISDVPRSPIPLVAVPLLWSAQALGVSFFINGMVKNPRGYIVFLATLGIAALPIAAITSWWAFFSQRTLLGISLFAASVIPAIISLIVSGKQETVNSARGDRNFIEILDF